MRIDFSTLPDWVNKKFYPLWFDHNRFIIEYGGAGCIHGNSLLDTPNGKIKIKDFKGGDVYSWDGEKVVTKNVILPKKYPVTRLYKITTYDGLTITVTAKHRFMTLDGWRTTAELLEMHQPNVLGVLQDPFQTKQDIFPLIQSVNVRRLIGKLLNFLGRYFACFRLCDELLRPDRDNDQVIFQQQVYVDEHTRHCLNKDARKPFQEYNHACQQSRRPSKKYSDDLLHSRAVNLLCYILYIVFVSPLQVCQKLFRSLLNFFLRLQVCVFDLFVHQSISNNTILTSCHKHNITYEQPLAISRLSYQYLSPLTPDQQEIANSQFHYRLTSSLVPHYIKTLSYMGDYVYYDITVPDTHCYFANGMLHHNSGKSVDAHMRMIYRVVSEPGHNYAVVRNVAASNSISTIPLTRKAIADWNFWSLFTENKTEKLFTCNHNGNQIKFLGLDDIEKIKSITFETGVLTDILIEEATEISEKDFNQLNLRLRGMAKVPFQITLLLNPISDSHWIKRRFFDNPGEKKDKITISHSTYLDNRFLDKEYKDELEALKYEDKMYYDIYALGKWGAIGNLVFRNIVYQECPYKPEEFDQIIAGKDFGFNHYDATELIGIKDGNKYSFSELYVRHMTNNEIIAENEKKGVLQKRQRCIADSAEPKSIKEWTQAGYNMVGAKKGADSVKEQISWLNRGTWYVDPIKCPGLVSEISTYKWKEDKDGNPLDEPVKFKDDAIAAARYSIEDVMQPIQGSYIVKTKGLY